MSHDYHQGAPNYHPDQLLIDGCHECKLRSRDFRTALAHMDVPTWQRAWSRAIQYGTEGMDNASGAEIPLLALLWQLSIKFDSCGLPDQLFDWLNDQARRRLSMDANHGPNCGCGYHTEQRDQAKASDQA